MDLGFAKLRFVQVEEQFESAAIIGTGASLKDVKLKFADNVAVIAVNAAIRYQHDSNFWFTLDPSRENADLMRHQRRGVTYYAAVPDNYRPTARNIKYLHRVAGDGHGHYKTKKRLSDNKGFIHTGNSAWGAFQLAIHMGAKRIGLFGIDGGGQYHYGGKPRELRMVPDLFESSTGQLGRLGVEVRNGSPDSTINCFNKATPQEVSQWLNSIRR